MNDRSPQHLPSPTPDPMRLGALEQQVMDVVWDKHPVAIRDIIDALPGEPAYTTIATVLRNLERKEMVRPKRRPGSVRYRPVRDREEYAAHLMQRALNTAGTNRESSMLHFVETLSPDDIDVLRRYLAENAEGRSEDR
jgi:predicted transcriptional regulator